MIEILALRTRTLRTGEGMNSEGRAIHFPFSAFLYPASVMYRPPSRLSLFNTSFPKTFFFDRHSNAGVQIPCHVSGLFSLGGRINVTFAPTTLVAIVRLALIAAKPPPTTTTFFPLIDKTIQMMILLDGVEKRFLSLSSLFKHKWWEKKLRFRNVHTQSLTRESYTVTVSPQKSQAVATILNIFISQVLIFRF